MAAFQDGPNDILSPRRQSELPELIEVLRRFAPTKIALEAAFYRGDVMSNAYRAYLDGEHQLTRNERQQLGFRLARELGHETVYSIDADGDFPLLTLRDYVKANGFQEEYDAVGERFSAYMSSAHEYRSAHSLLDALLHMNSDEYVRRLMEHDYEVARFGKPWNWAGPDLLSDFFHRNSRIYGNIVSLIEDPDERILVIIGAGHLPWLRHNFTADPVTRLRKLDEFAY